MLHLNITKISFVSQYILCGFPNALTLTFLTGVNASHGKILFSYLNAFVHGCHINIINIFRQYSTYFSLPFFLLVKYCRNSLNCESFDQK